MSINACMCLHSAGLKCESQPVPRDCIIDHSITCTPKAIRVPVGQLLEVSCTEVPEAECKLDASPEIKGPRRQLVEGAAPGSIHASRISSSRKGKEHQGQAGRVLRTNADGGAGGNPSPRSVRTSHRRVPVGWFPRGQKKESYLERKIRMLQVCFKSLIPLKLERASNEKRINHGAYMA